MPTDSPGHLEPPDSTLALFQDCLRTSVDTDQGRAKLFRLAAKLVKLNLSDDRQASRHGAVWDIIVAFLNRYPDFILFRQDPDNAATKSATGGGDGRGQDHEQEQEEMGCWLLPRLLRRLAVLGEGTDVGHHELSTKLSHAVEAAIVQMLHSLADHHWHREEKGIHKQREMAVELVNVMQKTSGAVADALPPQNITFPQRIWLFEKKARDGSSVVDPFSNQDQRNTRPFGLLLDNKIQSSALHLSVLRILISAHRLTSQWTFDYLPQTVSMLVGQPMDWGLSTDVKGKGRPVRSFKPTIARLEATTSLIEKVGTNGQVVASLPHLIQRITQTVDAFVIDNSAPGSEAQQTEVAEAVLSTVRSLSAFPNVFQYDPCRAVLKEHVKAHEAMYSFILNPPRTADPKSFVLDPMHRCFTILLSLLCETEEHFGHAESHVFWRTKTLASVTHAATLAPVASKGFLEILRHSQDSTQGDRLALERLERSSREVVDRKRDFQTHTDEAPSQVVMDIWRKYVPLGPDNTSAAGVLESMLRYVQEGEASAGLFRDLRILVCEASKTSVRLRMCCICDAQGQDAHYANVRHFGAGPSVVDPAWFDLMDRIAQGGFTSSSFQVTFYDLLRTLVLHGDPTQDRIDWKGSLGQHCLATLGRARRAAGLAAGRVCVSIIDTYMKRQDRVSPDGLMRPFFDTVESILTSKSELLVKATALSTIMCLAKTAKDEMLARVLGLLVSALTSRTQLKALIITQMADVVSVRDTTILKLVAPHLDYICPLLVSRLDSNFGLLYAFVDLLGVSVPALLQMQGVTRLFVAQAIALRRIDFIEFLAEKTDSSIGELLIVNIDAIFAPLYFQSPTKLSECSQMLLRLLSDNGAKGYTLQQVLTSNLPALMLEILIHAGNECDGSMKLRGTFKRLFSVTDPSSGSFDEQMTKHMLAIFGRASDMLRGMYGRKSNVERLRIIRALSLLIELVGPAISKATPQAIVTLQSCFKDEALRHDALLLWESLLRALSFEDVKPILAQTTATLVQTWDSFDHSQRTRTRGILHYILVENERYLGESVHDVADLSSIPDLADLHTRLMKIRRQQTFSIRVAGFLRRLDTVNEAVLGQALTELAEFLKQESPQLQKLATGTSFDPLLGQLVHALLTTSIKSGESKSSSRIQALQCLGVLGALDPDRISFPADEISFTIQHDLRDVNECMQFAQYVIEKVLVRVLKATSDPQQQAALFLAIQGLAVVCGFDEKVRVRGGGGFQPGVDAAVRERWKRLDKSAQEVLEPLLPTMIEVTHLPQQERPVYPLYVHKKSYREWLQAWASDLIAQLTDAKDGGLKRSNIGPDALFGPLRAAVIRGHDLTVAYFVLPYLVFYTVTSGHTGSIARIRTEIETVLQDQINPRSIHMTRDSRALCAQAIFELMDHLNTWIRARQVYLARKYRKSSHKAEMEQMLQPVRRVETMFKALPQNSVAEAALNSKSYARALLNYEKVLYALKPTHEQSKLQPYYEHLHHIYAELNEADGMEGISASIISPSIQHQIREHEMTGRWTSAQSCWEVQLQLQPDDPQSHLGLLRCLRNLGHYDSLRTHIAGLQTTHKDWEQLLTPYEIEGAFIAGDLANLEAILAREDVSCPEAAFAKVIVALRTARPEVIQTAFSQSADTLGSGITTANQDSYHRFYDSIVNLHILHDIRSLAQRPSRSELQNMAARLDMTAPTFRTRETILNMRRNALRIGSGSQDENIGPLWLSTSKIALKADHLQTAYSAILQASQLGADFTFVQSAKLYKANGQPYRALQEIDQGLQAFGVLSGNVVPSAESGTEVTQNLAKAALRSARWMQETGRFEMREVFARYKRAISLNPSWEAAYYRAGQYADDLVQSALAFSPGAAFGSHEYDNNAVLLGNMDITVHYFSKALRYGTKFIYQALPRLVTIWLDFGSWPEVCSPQPSGVSQAAKKSRSAANSVEEMVSSKLAQSHFQLITKHIRRALDKLPSYMWLAVLPQLVSRINHENPNVVDLLVAICEKVVRDYTQQAVWTMVGMLNSTVPSRQTRCQSILLRAQGIGKTSAQNANRLSAISRVIQTQQMLVKQLLDVSSYKSEGHDSLSMSRHFPALKAMVPCEIIMPFQQSMTVTLPSDPAQVSSHQPFPPNLTTFKGFVDEIEIMPSIARPRKLVIEGSDGKTYRFLAKPLDDLRKDARLLECTSLVNRLLKKDAESRKRNLHIRTYAVVPLNEANGLIEWVPDTSGVRNLWISLYEPRHIRPWSEQMKKIYDGIKIQQKTDPQKCGEVFSKQILPLYPPVFHEWFLDNFPEPTAWLKARTAYARTTAVMAMVGFVLGLGDRHGENILIDTTSGDCVHVDFNCLFGMGFVYFDIVEKVPFRLTQNVVDGFGITGVEGVFRRACEITLRILRENKNSLISVLESFVHDPLLDLQLARPTHRKSIGANRGESREARAKREEEARKTEARGALATISHKLKGTQSTATGPPGETISTVEMTVETLFKEATDPKNLGGMYVGWAAWM